MRIYLITDRKTNEERFVRAKTLNGAVRAVADEKFTGAAATTEQMFQAYKQGMEVLDATDSEEAQEQPKDG